MTRKSVQKNQSKNLLKRTVPRALSLAVLGIGFIVFLFLLFFLRPAVIIDPTPEIIPAIDTTPKVLPPAKRDITPGEDLPLTWKTPNIERMKTHGCVADGLLTGYNSPTKDRALARESNCYYFHRALQTWLEVPDFEEAHEAIAEINRPDALYGMFIAEAIDTKAEYFYRAENREFDFGEMCERKSRNHWGEHTCIPSLDEEEYRAYLKQITEDAMDAGIQVFLFGQVNHQEDDVKKPKIDNVIEEMKEYAASINMEIIVGAQTGDITNKKYLRNFDFIEGGIGVRPDGKIEQGPCFSKWWQKEGDWCWPLMWHETYTDRAEHILVYMDWNAQIGDDMSTFTRMSEEMRHTTLKNYHAYFTAPGREKIGFLPPILAPLARDNGGCHGSRLGFYSPHMDFGCRDIDVINALLE